MYLQETSRPKGSDWLILSHFTAGLIHHDDDHGFDDLDDLDFEDLDDFDHLDDHDDHDLVDLDDHDDPHRHPGGGVGPAAGPPCERRARDRALREEVPPAPPVQSGNYHHHKGALHLTPHGDVHTHPHHQ